MMIMIIIIIIIIIIKLALVNARRHIRVEVYLNTKCSAWSTPGRSKPTTYCIGGWVGPRASLAPSENRTLDHPARIIIIIMNNNSA
jgi:hypothetical protein